MMAVCCRSMAFSQHLLVEQQLTMQTMLALCQSIVAATTVAATCISSMLQQQGDDVVMRLTYSTVLVLEQLYQVNPAVY
jgi:NaMN:DMB phosphoribosyltransferase